MIMRVSRRTILAFGGSLLALFSGTAIWRSQSNRSVPPSRNGERPLHVIDHNGWMLTASDIERLQRRASAQPAGASPDAADRPRRHP